MRRASRALLLALLPLAPVCAVASDLGTSGPFRSLGDSICPAGTPDNCAPPRVDATLPIAQQVRRHVERALALLDLLQLTASRADLDEALRLDPDDLQALMLRGRLNLYVGDPSAARPDLEHALRLAPEDADILATLAIMSPPDEARRDLDIAVGRRPDDIDILLARARNRVGRNDIPAAFEDLSRILALAPDNHPARLLRARLNLRCHAYDMAVVDANKVLADQPQDPEALMLKGNALLGAGDGAGAIAAYTVLLDGPSGPSNLTVPAFREALINRGRLFANLGRTTEAKTDLATLTSQRGLQALLQQQLYLRGHGYPNVEITGQRTTTFDEALNGCFSDTVCGPNLFR